MLDTLYAVTASCDIVYDGTADTVRAGQTVVIPAHAAISLQRALQGHGKAPARVSRLGHYTRPYCGQDLNGKRLIAWRGAGVGDQLIFAGCLRYLANRYPGVQIVLLCDPRLGKALWEGAENLPFTLAYEPLPFADWKSADYHWIGCGLCDGDREPDQPDVFHGHLSAIGHPDAPVCWRFPFVPRSAKWDDQAAQFVQNLASGSVAEAAPAAVILWHLAASTPMRSITPEQTVAALELLHRERPDVRVILTGTPKQYQEYAGALACPNAAATTDSLPIQAVFALLHHVNLVVCPDSCLGHVAAEFETPAVSYWCSFSSRVRLTSYTNHHVIETQVAGCSPCFEHEDSATMHGCPLADTDDPAGRYCKGLKAIRPQEIVAKIKEIL